MRVSFGLSCLTALAALAGCVTPTPDRPTSGLEDTEWVLIGFQKSIDQPDLQEVRLYDYTMHLEASGAARFKFDCNQGSSTWQARSTDKGKGKLSFDTVAATTALCAAGSIGETLSADVGRISSYTIYDGRLTVFLEDEGPVYVWDSVD